MFTIALIVNVNRWCLTGLAKLLMKLPDGIKAAEIKKYLLKKWNGDRMPNGDPTISKESPRCCITETLICLAL